MQQILLLLLWALLSLARSEYDAQAIESRKLKHHHDDDDAVGTGSIPSAAPTPAYDDDDDKYLNDAVDLQTCTWTDTAHNMEFDVSQLIVTSDSEESYISKEQTYTYVWNVCAAVTKASIPDVCDGRDEGKLLHAVYQYNDNFCAVVGKFFSQKNESFSLIDEENPTKGISIKYPRGEKCSDDIYREAVVDIYCKNVEVNILSSQEPITCSYHMVMESYYGCPKRCPVTAKGLCNSVGSCEYDNDEMLAYCKCDPGYSGDDCSEADEGDTSTTVYAYVPSYDSMTTWDEVKLFFVIAFLFGLCGLCSGLGFMMYQNMNWRSVAGYISIPQLSKDDVTEIEI